MNKFSEILSSSSYMHIKFKQQKKQHSWQWQTQLPQQAACIKLAQPKS